MSLVLSFLRSGFAFKDGKQGVAGIGSRRKCKDLDVKRRFPREIRDRDRERTHERDFVVCISTSVHDFNAMQLTFHHGVMYLPKAGVFGPVSLVGPLRRIMRRASWPFRQQPE